MMTAFASYIFEFIFYIGHCFGLYGGVAFVAGHIYMFTIQWETGLAMIEIGDVPIVETVATLAICFTPNFKLLYMYIAMATIAIGSKAGKTLGFRFVMLFYKMA